MKVIFFGLGSIGLRHAALLKKNTKFGIYAFRTYKGQGENDLGIPELTSWQAVDRNRSEVAFITNPTALHISTAIKCAQRGMHLFIEKPLDNRMRNLHKLLRIVSRENITTYVAYVLRFHPVIQQLKRILKNQKILHVRVVVATYLHRWRPKFDTLKSYSAYRQMGGGVIWDLSHELDYVHYLLGGIQRMQGRFSRRSSLTVDSEDYADILIDTLKGPVNLHMNLFSQREERLIQIDCPDRYLEGDLRAFTLSEFREGKLSKIKRWPRDMGGCYLRQLQFFFKHLHHPRMMNNVFEAVPLWEKIYAFQRKGI